MARLILMQRLVTAGVAPAEAARWAQRSPLSAYSVSARSVSAYSLPALQPALSPVPAPRSGARGGQALTLRDADPVAWSLGRAALRLDALGARDIVTGTVGERGVAGAWNDVLRPVLVAVGARAASGTDLVEVEHILSGCISAVFASVPRPSCDTPVRLLLSCADEEQHSLPIEALAAALAQRGIPTRVLGARVPPGAVRATVRRTGPAAVLLWAHTPATADPKQLDELVTGRGRPTLVVAAGPGWEPDALPPDVAVPESLLAAADLLAAAAG
jgi:hypothetical protein